MVRPVKKHDWAPKPEEFRTMRFLRQHVISNYGRILDADKNPIEYYFNDKDELCADLEDVYGESHAPVWMHMLYCFFDGTDLEDVYFEYADSDPTNLYLENLIPMWVDKQGIAQRLQGRPTYFDRLLLDKRYRNAGRKVMIVETTEVFDSPKAVAEAIGGYTNLVYKVLKGSARSHMGYTFKYVE